MVLSLKCLSTSTIVVVLVICVLIQLLTSFIYGLVFLSGSTLVLIPC